MRHVSQDRLRLGELHTLLLCGKIRVAEVDLAEMKDEQTAKCEAGTALPCLRERRP